ncbi:EAL domain, c-di-GMP-specific phosphodiesterase class I (or its enzymatically inactive variant) [Jannaschia faecimaris]|uniref:EAL domain, c-di-GMP-specific phosphodiesterase class I (Or its enzymatically inactive variant) n=1 Tax=Jannaschia faecimaris TaxID=1244108 RepID=A0A1H3P466_9RHOB|nr:EAL domain-containing protein [Jannaschia faecimaris]SDY95907.1 EAL domain, c-di-GMP-specific phosphodiesterase class I (or its enzymatically inactive variant) [Jannaschia faecimaris]
MHQKKVDTKSAIAVNGTTLEDTIDRALAAVREHLDMPISYLSEFVGEETIFRHVSAPGLEDLIRPGASRSLDEVYCRLILSGELPELIADTSTIPLARDMPITQIAPIGSHVSMPIHREDGSVYGMFCCLSPTPKPSLNDRDLKVMRLFANLAAEQVRARLVADGDTSAAAARIAAALRDRAFDIAYQPIYRLTDGALSSFEALARFRSDPYRTPDKWFADAETAGRLAEAETCAVEAALTRLKDLPPNLRMSVNASPDTVASGRLLPLFGAAGGHRLTLEVTEHQSSSDFAALARAVANVRATGALIAIDDVGAGYAGLQQILKLRPDILKLDMSLVRNLDLDPARRSLAAALVHFASETNSRLTAEGIERPEERDMLRQLGIDYGQGYLLGYPGEISSAAARIAV